MRWAAGTIVACVLLASPVAATLSASVEIAKGPIVPEVESRVANVTVSLDCPSALRHISPTSQEIPVHLIAISTDPNVAAAGPGLGKLAIASCQANPLGSISVLIPLGIGANRNAPGGQKIKIDFEASLDPTSQAAPSSETATTSTDIVVGYFPLLQAKAVSKIQELPPGTTTNFTIELANFGNAQTTVTYNVTLPNDDKLFDLVSPAPAILERGSQQSVNFTVTAHGGTNWQSHEQQILIIFTPSSTLNPAEHGNVLTANLLVLARGFSNPLGAKASPDAPLAMVGVAALVATMVARRRP